MEVHPMATILTIMAAISATFHIWAEYHGPPMQVYVCKPLTMLLIIAIAARRATAGRGWYSRAILGGLLFSIAGDVFLMLPSDRFIPGLVSFLIGHLWYIAAFAHGRPFRTAFSPLVVFALYGIVIYLVLSPHLGAVKGPVALYIVVILIMGWQSCARWSALRTRAALLAAAGAVLFIISDSILAVNRFHTHFLLARLLNLSTYFIAQWCMAVSIGEMRNEK
jgi:uncharacterized membrane protein YhhN